MLKTALDVNYSTREMLKTALDVKYSTGGMQKTAFDFNYSSGGMLKIALDVLKYKLTFFSVRMFIETPYMSHPPYPRLYSARSHPFKKQFNDQSNIGPLCANTNMEMIDSALCKWTLYGFCRLMGLEPCQKRSTPFMSTLPLSSNHEMLRSST